MGTTAQRILWISALMAVTIRCSSAQNLQPSPSSPLEAVSGRSAPSTTSEPSPADKDISCKLHITSQHDYLTITAERCPLADVLLEIKHQTGAAVDIPSGEAQELVWMDGGPAPVREVLVSLLYGSSVDYAILGSLSDPNQVTRVILKPKLVKPGVNEVAKTPSIDSTGDEAQEETPYGVGFSVKPDTDSENQPAAISRSAELAAQQSPNGQKTQGQILDELQKEQMKKLDEKANSSPQ